MTVFRTRRRTDGVSLSLGQGAGRAGHFVRGELVIPSRIGRIFIQIGWFFIQAGWSFIRTGWFFIRTGWFFPDFVIAYPKKYKSYNFSRQECKKQGFSRIGGRACYFTRLFARLPKQQKQPLIIKHLQTYFEKVTKSGGHSIQDWQDFHPDWLVFHPGWLVIHPNWVVFHPNWVVFYRRRRER